MTRVQTLWLKVTISKTAENFDCAKTAGTQYQEGASLISYSRKQPLGQVELHLILDLKALKT